MTRINTNITALTAQQNLANSNNQLQITLTRLSTGLRINSGADDPAGMIAASNLGVNIKTSQQAIGNSQAASQMISTADNALSQISSLLTTISGLITQAANTSSMSSSQIAANQLQIDSSLSAINNITQTTTFQGQNLLNGNFDFSVAKDTGFSKIQNLRVNQVNFGTASQVPVDIHVSAVAKQAQIGATVNDGVGSDVKATSTVTFADGSTISLQAPGSGVGANGIRVIFSESSTIGAGKASAAFNSTTQTLNVTVANTGKTTAATIASAITAGTDFTVTAATGGNVGYVAGTDTAVNANTTVTTAGAGTLVISSLTPGTGQNGKTVTFTEGDATNGPTVSVSAGGNLTVTINDATHNGGQTTLASIAAAINNYVDAGGHNVFSASVTNAGSFNTAVNPTTRLALDGFGAPQAKTDSVTNVSLPGGNTLALTALGASANGARVVVHQVTSGPGTAVWDATANGGKGQLTLNLSTVGGTGGAGNVGLYTAGDIGGLITAAGSPFTSDTTGITSNVDATTLTGVDQITAVGNGTPGVDGWSNNSSAANLASGAGTGGVFASGTGVSGLAASLVIQVTGDAGGQLFSFLAGTTARQIATQLNQATDGTGVVATTEGDQLKFNSVAYGKAATVSVKVVSEGTGGSFNSSLTAGNATGSDIIASVNNAAADGQANTVSVSAPNLAFSASLDPTQVNVGDDIKFTITGGGALFQLGPQVTSAQQANLGIQSTDTTTLGGTAGRLYELGTGKDASLATNPTKAALIIQEALASVTSLRGMLGAFQTATISTNISALTNAVTNLTAAQSSIQDADFAVESANLSREQILVQSGTTVAGIASSTPANVLSLLQKAAQV